jgi:hypothetical protein
MSDPTVTAMTDLHIGILSEFAERQERYGPKLLMHTCPWKQEIEDDSEIQCERCDRCRVERSLRLYARLALGRALKRLRFYGMLPV